MPSPTYSVLVQTVSAYVDPQRARDVINRQLSGANKNPDTFTGKDLVQLMIAITTATKMYVPDPSRKEELVAKIKSLAT